MKHLIKKGLLALMILVAFLSKNTAFAQDLVPLLRYNNGTDHLYQTDPYAYGGPEAFGYWYEGYEGYVYRTPQPGTVPLYRFTNDKDHAYQLERNGPEAFGYRFEEICCYVYPNGGNFRAPLYRYSNGTDNMYQTSKTRYGGPEAYGHHYVGIEGYVSTDFSSVQSVVPFINVQPCPGPVSYQDGSKLKITGTKFSSNGKLKGEIIGLPRTSAGKFTFEVTTDAQGAFQWEFFFRWSNFKFTLSQEQKRLGGWDIYPILYLRDVNQNKTYVGVIQGYDCLLYRH